MFVHTVFKSRRECGKRLCLLAVLFAWGDARATEVSFNFANSIELGMLLDGAGVGDFVMDPLFLGTEFDKTIRAGTIVGSPNALVFPAIPFLGIPEVRADTRTGARLEAQITGRAGLELNAGLSLGGLEADAVFNYSPTLDVPDVIRSGQFFSLRGSSGLDTGGAFGVDQVDLPSASFSADVIFDVNAAGKVDCRFEVRPGTWLQVRIVDRRRVRCDAHVQRRRGGDRLGRHGADYRHGIRQLARSAADRCAGQQ